MLCGNVGIYIIREYTYITGHPKFSLSQLHAMTLIIHQTKIIEIILAISNVNQDKKLPDKHIC